MSQVQGAVDKGIQATSEPNGKSRAAQGNSEDPAAARSEAPAPHALHASSLKHKASPELPIATNRFAFRQASLRTHRDCGYVAELAMAVQRQC